MTAPALEDAMMANMYAIASGVADTIASIAVLMIVPGSAPGLAFTSNDGDCVFLPLGCDSSDEP